MEYYKGIIHIESSKSMTKEQIFEAVKSGLTEDFEEFYLGLTKVNGTYESLDKPSTKSKKS
jgi:hypothetical protein